MTETPRPPVLPLTLERLEEMQRHFDRTLGLGISELRQLFQHIDALEAALQAARAERDKARANALDEAEARIVYNLDVNSLDVRALFTTMRNEPSR